MAVQASVIARIRKVLALTSSPVPAEAEAARAKVRELLALHGLSLKQVRDGRETPRLATVHTRTVDQPPPFMKSSAGRGTAAVRNSLGDTRMTLTEDEASRLADVMDLVGHNVEQLRGKERDFATEQLEKWDELGAAMYLSRRQWEWLESIASRYA